MKNKLCPRCDIEKGITAFSKDKTKLDGLESCCKSCKKGSRNLEKNREFYHKNKKYHQEYRNKSQKFVQLCKQTLGCFYCNDMDDVCLDFHHVELKKYDITKVNSIDAIIKEMSKCICVCCNCHRKIHAGKLIVPDSWKIDECLLISIKEQLT